MSHIVRKQSGISLDNWKIYLIPIKNPIQPIWLTFLYYTYIRLGQKLTPLVHNTETNNITKESWQTIHPQIRPIYNISNLNFAYISINWIAYRRLELENDINQIFFCRVIVGKTLLLNNAATCLKIINIFFSSYYLFSLIICEGSFLIHIIIAPSHHFI